MILLSNQRQIRFFIFVPFFLTAFVISFSNCGSSLLVSSSDSSKPSTTFTFHSDVAPILRDNCMSCHQAGGSAPFPLTTYREVALYGPQVAQAVEDRVMPPWGAQNSGSCQTFKDSHWLSDENVHTITDWARGGMPEGDSSKKVSPPEAPAPLDRTDLTLEMKKDFYPPFSENVEDIYQCFVLEPGLNSDQYLTGYEVTPGNKDIVHHVVLYHPNAVEDAVNARSLDPNGDGYSCYGGASPDVGPVINASPLAVFAVGTPVQYLPPQTGLRLKAQAPVIMQVHYHTHDENQSGLNDKSKISLKLENIIPTISEMKMAAIFDMSMVLEDNKERTTYTVSKQIRNMYGVPPNTNSGRIWGVFPHMHTHGVSIKANLSRASSPGSNECLIDVPFWQFGWQQHYFYDQYSIDVASADTITLTCTYNTLGIYGLGWGEGSEDEMCLGYFYFTL